MTFELAPVDGLADDELKEMANLFAAKCQKSAQQTVKDAIVAGNALNELKLRAKHGEWRAWLRKNFDYSFKTATTYMALASNVKRFTFEPTSIRTALKAIAEEKDDGPVEPEITPRTDRVTGRVAVANAANDIEQTIVESDENTVPAEPKSDIKHSKATTQAKESDRSAPPIITPVIVQDQADLFSEITLADWSVTEILKYLKDSADDPKKRARELRKTADLLDPPTKFSKPDITEVCEYFAELKAADAESFFDFYESKGWMVGKVSMKDWRASARKWIRANQQNGEVNGHGKSSNNGRRGFTAEEVFG